MADFWGMWGLRVDFCHKKPLLPFSAGYTVGASNGKGEDHDAETATIPSLATDPLRARGDTPAHRSPHRWVARLVASIEARLQHALDELRRTNNTMAVVLLQVGKADELIGEFQDMMNRFVMSLHGDTKKAALIMEKRCQDWRTTQQRIQL